MKRAALYLALLTPLLYLLYRLFLVGVEDPVKYIYTVTGFTALTLLYIVTSFSLIRKKINLARYRRAVGLFAFFYAFLHFLNFIILDMELDIALALNETLKKPFIYLGMGAFAILIFMAVTSFRTLFAKFYKYHQLIYVGLLLATVHFVMAQKALAYWQWEILAAMAVIAVLKFLQKTKLVKF